MFDVVDREVVLEIIKEHGVDFDDASDAIRALPSMKDEILDHVLYTCCTYVEPFLTPQEKARIGRALGAVKRNIRALKDKK